MVAVDAGPFEYLCSAASNNMEPQFIVLAWVFLIEILSFYNLIKLNQSPLNAKFWNVHYMWKTQTGYIPLKPQQAGIK